MRVNMLLNNRKETSKEKVCWFFFSRIIKKQTNKLTLAEVLIYSKDIVFSSILSHL